MSDKKSEEKQVAKIEVTASEYNLRQTHENSYVLDVKGKVKNTGNVDVKKVIVTGYCRSCILEFTGHRWFTSDCDKTENQKDTISYLAVGAEEDFSFEEVAFYFTHSLLYNSVVGWVQHRGTHRLFERMQGGFHPPYS